MLRIPNNAKKIAVDESTGADVYRWGECKVLVSGEEERKQIGWHLSISHPDRYPTWDEIYSARYALLPAEAYMVMPLPPPEEYVNIHKNCFHLFQQG